MHACIHIQIYTQCNFKNLGMNFKLHQRSQIWPIAYVCFNKVLLVHIPNPLTHMLSVAACYYHGKGKYFHWLHGRQRWEHLPHGPLQVVLASTCLRASSIQLQQLQKRPIPENIGSKTESSSLQTKFRATWPGIKVLMFAAFLSPGLFSGLILFHYVDEKTDARRGPPGESAGKPALAIALPPLWK